MYSLICPEKKIFCLNFIGPTLSQQIFGFCLTFVFFCYFCVFCSVFILNWYCFVLLPVFLAGIQPTSANLFETTKKTVPKYLFIHILLVIVDSFTFFSVFAFAEFAIRKILFGLALLFIVADTHAHKICYVKLCKYLLRFLFTMTDQAMELKNSLSARSALKTIRECWTLECWIAWCIIKNVIIATNL